MKIAINARFLLGENLEGMGRYTHELMQRLVRLCPDDEFLFLFDRSFEEQFIYGKNVKAFVVSPPARHPILWYWWFEKSIPKILRKEKVDLFISLDGYCSISSKVPTLMVIHDLAYLHYPDQIKRSARKYYQKWIPKFCKRADLLATISEASKKDIAKNFNINSEEIKVIPNGFNPKFSALTDEEKIKTKDKYSSGENYFCCLGAIHPRKNIEGTIRAFNQYKTQTKSKEKLLIIGRMAWKTDEVKSVYENSLFQSDIHFLGYLPDEEVHLILGASKALLFLSFFEGFGVPLLEAMQLQVPTIYSNCSVMPEVAGNTGLCVDLSNINEITEAMSTIESIKGPAYEATRKAKLSKYNWDHAADLLKNYVATFR